MEDNRLSAGHFSRREMLKTTAGVAGAVGVATLGNLVRADDANKPFIHTYAGPISCEQGETVDLFVSTSANQYAIEVARLGAQRTIVYERSGITGARHEAPADASYNGCRWPKPTGHPATTRCCSKLPTVPPEAKRSSSCAQSSLGLMQKS